MNDFFDSLKDIKSQMVKEQKAAAPTKKTPKPNPNRDEFRDIFNDESVDDKENRLRDEFKEFVAHANVRRI